MRLFAKACYKAVSGKIIVSTDFLFFFAAALLLVPIQWLVAWILALTVHELCHYIALRLCGGAVTRIQIGCRGVIMDTQPLSFGREALCAYAGPLGGLIILLFARFFPRTAICSLVFSLYNLLPILPLDGGRGLGCLLKKIFPTTIAERVLGYVENSVLMGVFAISLYSVFRLGLGLLPAFIAVILFLRSKQIKIPCKKRQLGLQ